MTEQQPQAREVKFRAIGVFLSITVGIVWVVYGMTGAPGWLLITAVVYSMLIGAHWAVGGTMFVESGRRDR